MSERLSLKQITEKEPFLVVDSNIITISMIADELYDSKRFKQISPDLLQSRLENFQHSYELFTSPNVNIVDAVVDEFMPLKRILSDKLSYLRRNELRFGNRKARYEGKNNNLPQQAILEQICSYLPRIESKMKRKIFKPANQEVYTELVELIKHLREKLNLTKLHCGDKSHYKHPYESKNNRCTDDKIAAAALYKAIYECSPAAILTKDGDITTLVGSFSQIVGNKAFAPESGMLLTRTKTNPIRMYTTTSPDVFDEYYCHTSISIKYEDPYEFSLHKRGSGEKISDKETAEAKKLISHCLKSITQSRSG